jgi:hypothetical protein
MQPVDNKDVRQGLMVGNQHVSFVRPDIVDAFIRKLPERIDLKVVISPPAGKGMNSSSFRIKGRRDQADERADGEEKRARSEKINCEKR